MLSTQTIYRVENKQGGGMYRGGHPVTDQMSGAATDDSGRCRHPMPHNDQGLFAFYDDGFMPEKHQFAFGSIQQLKFWIYRREWREELEADGFTIKMICADAIVGDTQAIFDKTTRQDVETLQFSDL